MSRLLTAGGESGRREQCEFTNNLSDNFELGVDAGTTTVPDHGSGSRYAYRIGSDEVVEFAHTNITEGYGRDRLYVDNATIGETIWLIILTDSSGLERYHQGNQNGDLWLELQTDGSIKLKREQSAATLLAQSATGVVLPATWHLFQWYFKVANSGGRFVLKIDGTTVIDFTGDTLSTINVTGGENILVLASSFNRHVLHDDVAVNDPTGTFNNSYPADRGVIGIVPEAMGTGTNNLDGTPQATNRYLNIDEVPSSDADYNFDSTSGQYDLYTLEDPGAGEIAAVELWARTTYPATASTFKFVHKYSGTEYRSAALAPSFFVTYPPIGGVDGPAYRHVPINAIPGTSNPWTLTAFSSLEAGFEVATSQEMRLLQLVVEVEAGLGCFLEQNDGLLKINAAGGSKTVLLDRATGKVGQVFYIKRVDGSTNTVTLDPVDTTIDREDSLELMARDGIILIYDGAEWWSF